MPALPLDDAGPYVAAVYLVFLALILIYVAIMASKLVRIARQVSHPNVCRVYDIGEWRPEGAPGQPPEVFLSMEYIDGEDLAALLKRVGRLTDFGLAAVAADLTPADRWAGTPVYMAPEQRAGQEVSARTDVYTLGLVLYGAALKFFVFGALVVRLALPFSTGLAWADWGVFVGGMLGLAVLTGVVESVMARLRMSRVPQLLVGASVLSAFGLVLLLR